MAPDAFDDVVRGGEQVLVAHVKPVRLFSAIEFVLVTRKPVVHVTGGHPRLDRAEVLPGDREQIVAKVAGEQDDAAVRDHRVDPIDVLPQVVGLHRHQRRAHPVGAIGVYESRQVSRGLDS